MLDSPDEGLWVHPIDPGVPGFHHSEHASESRAFGSHAHPGKGFDIDGPGPSGAIAIVAGKQARATMPLRLDRSAA